MYIPVFGRLSLLEWLFVVVSFILTWLEWLSSILTLLLPKTVIKFISVSIQIVYSFSSNPIRFISSIANGDDTVGDPNKIRYSYESGTEDSQHDAERHRLMNSLLNSKDISEMVGCFGYSIESHVVRTRDDYLLTVQRLIKPEGSPIPPRNGKVVYMHHGLLMCSEIFVTMIDKYSNLPYVLYDLGYDVWFGNNRGNKYSHKHLVHLLRSEKFWDFSLDEFAFYDIPDSVRYILDVTKKASLTYIGFSQGTAQAFASVSVNPDLNDKIDRIVAISPATTPHGLYSKFLDIMLKSSPHTVFLLFSRKALMPSVKFWEKVMYPPFFDTSIDLANFMLFNWKALNIEKHQKIASYAHLYSTTSVKTVVHWFQIISSKNFQMYHNDSSNFSGFSPISYPLKNIQVPIDLVYGDADSLVDISVMERQLPKTHVTSHAVHDHEHLDNLWGRDVATRVFPQVLAVLGETVKVD